MSSDSASTRSASADGGSAAPCLHSRAVVTSVVSFAADRDVDRCTRHVGEFLGDHPDRADHQGLVGFDDVAVVDRMKPGREHLQRHRLGDELFTECLRKQEQAEEPELLDLCVIESSSLSEAGGDSSSHVCRISSRGQVVIAQLVEQLRERCPCLVRRRV